MLETVLKKKIFFEAFIESGYPKFLLKGAMAIRWGGDFNGEDMTTSYDVISQKRVRESFDICNEEKMIEWSEVLNLYFQCVFRKGDLIN